MRGGFLDGLCLFLEIKQHPAELRRWHQKIRRIYYIRLWFLFFMFFMLRVVLNVNSWRTQEEEILSPFVFCYFLIPLIMTYSYLLPKIDFNLLQMTKMETDNYSLILLFFFLVYFCMLYLLPAVQSFLIRFTKPHSLYLSLKSIEYA